MYDHELGAFLACARQLNGIKQVPVLRHTYQREGTIFVTSYLWHAYDNTRRARTWSHARHESHQAFSGP